MEVWNFHDTMKLAGVIKDIYDSTEPEDRPSEINVDGNGIGKGVYDALRSWRHYLKPAPPIRANTEPVRRVAGFRARQRIVSRGRFGLVVAPKWGKNQGQLSLRMRAKICK